jgi:multiple sugar transport system ATP-binding protein
MAEVAIEAVSKRFGATEAVQDLSLTIHDGEFVVLLGPTGAGKTTTLRLVAGLEEPDAGKIVIGGRKVSGEPPASRDVAFVFQQYSLYPHLNVFDNIAFPLRSPARRMPEPQVAAKVREIARLLQIEDKLDSRATHLSGGQMQRVAIGRALVRRPAIYLMDEPLSSLDAKLRAELRLELKRIQQELGTTILYVTHDQTEAMTMANRIGVINEGRLMQVGSPRQVYEDPSSVYVAQRLGQPQINLLPADLVPNGKLPAGAATLGIRTEHLAIARAKSGQGTVERVEHLGDQNHLHVKVNGHRIVTLVAPDSRLAAGDRVSLKPAKPLYFDRSGDRIRY